MSLGIELSHNYNPATRRIDFPAGFLKFMPKKVINNDTLSELKCHADFNPYHYYEHKVKLFKNEEGHDNLYRYILQDGTISA